MPFNTALTRKLGIKSMLLESSQAGLYTDHKQSLSCREV